MTNSKKTGVILRGLLNARDPFVRDADYEAILLAMEGGFRVFVNDGPQMDVSPRFYEHPSREQPGLPYVVPIHDLSVGEHTVRVDRQELVDKELRWETGYSILFYT